jgi:hypothetical protein
VRDAERRHRTAGHGGPFDDDLGRLLRREVDRLRESAQIEWDAADELLDAAVLD